MSPAITKIWQKTKFESIILLKFINVSFNWCIVYFVFQILGCNRSELSKGLEKNKTNNEWKLFPTFSKWQQ